MLVQLVNHLKLVHSSSEVCYMVSEWNDSSPSLFCKCFFFHSKKHLMHAQYTEVHMLCHLFNRNKKMFEGGGDSEYFAVTLYFIHCGLGDYNHCFN